MKSICFYFQVHQPFRLKQYKVFDIGKSTDYFDDTLNAKIMQKVAKKCYLPTNNLMLNLIKKHKGKFKIAYSITGTALDQFEKYAPDVLQSFIELSKTGCVEFLSETYYHSLSFLFSKKEFKEQVELHKKKIKELFNIDSIEELYKILDDTSQKVPSLKSTSDRIKKFKQSFKGASESLAKDNLNPPSNEEN